MQKDHYYIRKVGTSTGIFLLFIELLFVILCVTSFIKNYNFQKNAEITTGIIENVWTKVKRQGNKKVKYTYVDIVYYVNEKSMRKQLKNIFLVICQKERK